MKNYFITYLVVILTLLVFIHWSSCTHDPFPLDEIPVDPMDTTDNPIDTMMMDTTGGQMGMPCDSDLVYFKYDILPILNSNCAISGCHDPQTSEGGFSLNNYENVINSGKVTPFDLSESDLYEVLVETDPDKSMPPPPREKLGADQLSLIAKWILQGAEDLTCDMDSVTCDTVSMSFNLNVEPILDNHCRGCHTGENPPGGINLTSHSGVVQAIDGGRLLGAITHDPNYENMPQGQDKLPDCEINTIRAWVNQGAKDN